MLMFIGVVSFGVATFRTISDIVPPQTQKSPTLQNGQPVNTTATVLINEIVANHQISGEIYGLTPKEYPNYKVIVYVHTDQWYIHPYAGQDEGKSWASIEANGTWRIQTVQRGLKADKVAALLVKQNYPEPCAIERLENIQSNASSWWMQELRGTQNYGKL